MTGNLTFYDAAFPPGRPPLTDGFACYLGGDTPHVWTRAEIAVQPAALCLPIFVRSDPALASARADVVEALNRLGRIGAPRGCLVAWDTETAADPSYIATVYAGLWSSGYHLIDYGSQDAVFGNHNPDGYYWGAQWTGSPHIANGDSGTQYRAGAAWDLSIFRPGLPFWDRRHPGGVHRHIPPINPAWQEHIMRNLPTTREGDRGSFVRTVQALANARGTDIEVDGIFGPLTDTAVKTVQRQADILVDGIVGPQTWPVLIGVG